VVEQQSWQELVVHRDVADTVDSMLRGQTIMAEERTRDEESGRVSARRITSGGMDVPTWGIEGFGGVTRQSSSSSSFDRSGPYSAAWGGGNGSGSSVRRMPQQGSRDNGGGGNRSQQLQVRALAPTGTAPGDVQRQNTAGLVAVERERPQLLSEGIYAPEEAQERLPIMKTLRIYPFGVSRDRLSESARQLRVPIIVTNNQADADAIVTLKNYYRRQPERLQEAEQNRKMIIILKNNTVAQMQHALARIFDIPVDTRSEEDADESDVGNGSSGSDDPTMRALLETEDAIHQVLNKGLTTAELPPANAYIRRLQHQMATRYNLISRSRGKEPNRRVKIFQSRE
jgi:hypothetical protein